MKCFTLFLWKNNNYYEFSMTCKKKGNDVFFRNLTKWIFFFFYCCRTKMKFLYHTKKKKNQIKSKTKKSYVFVAASTKLVLCWLFPFWIYLRMNSPANFISNLYAKTMKKKKKQTNVHNSEPKSNQFKNKRKIEMKGSTFARYACAFNGCISNTKNQ